MSFFRYVADREQCRDNDAEVHRIFGEPVYADYSVCLSAMARIDGRFEKGVGCRFIFIYLFIYIYMVCMGIYI